MNKNTSNTSSLNNKYKKLLYLTGSSVFEIDTATSEGKVSGFLKDIFGIEDDILLSTEKYFEKISFPFNDSTIEKLKNAIEFREAVNLTFAFKYDDEKLWVKVNGVSLNDDCYFIVHQTINADEALHDIELGDNLKNILNFIPVPLMVFSENEQINFINKTFSEVTGYDHQNISTIKDWVKAAYPTQSEKVYQFIQHLFDIPGRVEDGVFYVRISSGETKPFHFFSAPLGKNENGQKQILTIAIDISESLRKDRLIDQQSEELNILTDKLPYLILTADPQGEILYANKNAIEITGYSLEEIKTKWVHLIHPEDQQHVLSQRENSLKNGNELNVDFRLQQYDGSFRWFNIKVIPIQDSGGKIIKWLGGGIDIHEQYISQQQLTESLKTEVSHLDEIIESLPQIAFTMDAEGNVDYFNKRWYQFTNQSSQDALRYGWIEALHPEDKEISETAILKGIKNQKEYHFEARIHNRNSNKYFWHILKSIPVKNNDGKLKYWIATATNIHEQKMLEYHKGEFLNVASHELRTPLTSLTGYLQLMQDALSQEEHESLNFYLEKSLNSTTRINRLINDLLNLSNVDSGKIADFHKEKVDFRKFLRDIVFTYRRLYPEREFFFNADQENYTANINAFRIEQVIDNLITNAIKYAPGSAIRINLQKHDDLIQVKVKDKGDGIPQDKLSAVFDRFYRIKDNSLSSGLGVGLFISREIIQQHNGKIWAEAPPNNGTTFIFEIPTV